VSTHLRHEWIEEFEHHLYVWRIPPEPSTVELRRALATIQKWIRELDEPYGWINDPRALRVTTIAVERKMLADHLRLVEPYSIRHCRGMATIVNGPVVRGIMTAINWLYTYPFPVTCCATEDAALTWVRAQLLAPHYTRHPPA